MFWKFCNEMIPSHANVFETDMHLIFISTGDWGSRSSMTAGGVTACDLDYVHTGQISEFSESEFKRYFSKHIFSVSAIITFPLHTEL